MKQQTYGNIEDMVNKITLVTSVGVMEKDFIAPRVSIGPDFHQVVLGSEGTLGVITKVIIKVHKKPEVRKFGSIVFADFELGSKFMHEVSKFPIKPSSLRLVDNFHCQIGMTFESNKTKYDKFVNFLKMFTLTNFYGFDTKKFALVTYMIENGKENAKKVEEKLHEAAKMFRGVVAGEDYGIRTHLMTLVVCYTRVY
jgi:alkyldihydroxyacetonephosphate synthase